MSGLKIKSKALLPAVLVAAMGFGAGVAQAAVTINQINVVVNGKSHLCDLSRFEASGATFTADVGNCPALAGASGGGNDGGGNNGGGNDGGGNDGGGNDGGGNDGGGNDGGGNDGGGNDGGGNDGGGGGSVGGSDPRVGTWSPDLNAEPRVVIVNQSGGTGTTKSIVPGCVNGGDVGWGTWCSSQSEYQASIDGKPVSVRLTKGQIVGVRYPLSGDNRTGSTGVLRLTNSVGGALGVQTKVSLSAIPGDMTGGGQGRCVNESALTPSITTGTTAFSCKIDRKQAVYYLNIEVKSNCSGSNCIFHISEESSEFN